MLQERVLQVKPKSVIHRRKLADLYRVDGELQRAISHYELLFNVDAKDKKLVEILALLNQDLGDFGQALKWRGLLLSEGDFSSSFNRTNWYSSNYVW